ncbi:MAG: hypothetical protein ACJ776_06560, partial [Chloroflexota bacterium]
QVPSSVITAAMASGAPEATMCSRTPWSAAVRVTENDLVVSAPNGATAAVLGAELGDAANDGGMADG